MSYKHSIDGSYFVVNPIETHLFKERGADWLCKVCARPRALHAHDGFTPGNPPHAVTMDGRVRYGRHPYFWKPKSILLNREEQARIDAICSRKHNLPVAQK